MVALQAPTVAPDSFILPRLSMFKAILNPLFGDIFLKILWPTFEGLQFLKVALVLKCQSESM